MLFKLSIDQFTEYFGKTFRYDETPAIVFRDIEKDKGRHFDVGNLDLYSEFDLVHETSRLSMPLSSFLTRNDDFEADLLNAIAAKTAMPIEQIKDFTLSAIHVNGYRFTKDVLLELANRMSTINPFGDGKPCELIGHVGYYYPASVLLVVKKTAKNK